MNSAYYIEMLKEKKGWNYSQCARELGLSKQSMTSYRNNNVEMDDETAIGVAQLLELDPLHVVANVRAARYKEGKAKDFWTQIAASAAMITFVTGTSLSLLQVTDTYNVSENDCAINLYYVK